MKFKKNVETIYSSDFWYDLTDGGYIVPKNILESEDAAEVERCISVIQRFEQEAKDADIIMDC